MLWIGHIIWEERIAADDYAEDLSNLSSESLFSSVVALRI